MLQVKLLSANATMPTRWSPQSAGFDICAAECKLVPAGGMAVIATDLSIACPDGTYARIAPRRQVMFCLTKLFPCSCNNCSSFAPLYYLLTICVIISPPLRIYTRTHTQIYHQYTFFSGIAVEKMIHCGAGVVDADCES